MGRVGIVVPALDAGEFIHSTLESIEVQSFRDWTCVVVDDGSSDGTAEVAESFARRDARFEVRREAHAGPCAARNTGMADVVDQVEYLSFMDADDMWMPDTLARLLEAAERDPAAVGAHGLAEFVDETGAPLMPGSFSALGRARLGCRGGWPRRVGPTVPTGFEHVVTQSVLFPPGVMIARASVYRAAGGFDEEMRYAEDWDMVIRLARHGHLAFVDDPVLWYRRHDANVGTTARVPSAAAAVRRKAYFSPENTPAQRKLVRDAWRAVQVVDARARVRDARRLFAAKRPSRAVAELVRLPLLVGRYVRGTPQSGPAR